MFQFGPWIILEGPFLQVFKMLPPSDMSMFASKKVNATGVPPPCCILEIRLVPDWFDVCQCMLANACLAVNSLPKGMDWRTGSQCGCMNNMSLCHWLWLETCGSRATAFTFASLRHCIGITSKSGTLNVEESATNLIMEGLARTRIQSFFRLLRRKNN